MLYFILGSNGRVVRTALEIERDGVAKDKYTYRGDFDVLADAEKIAAQATEATGKLHIATDSGSGCHPRFDVIEAPKVGDKVSQYFNGDSYPRGTIVSVSKTLKKVTTDTGAEFYRRGNTGAWLINGYASMIHGHVSETNPSF